MQAYLDLLSHILDHGEAKPDRTGTGTLLGLRLSDAVSACRTAFRWSRRRSCTVKSIVHELLWFLRGDTNIAYLKEHGVSIWDEWADAEGDLGPIYGKQWRAWQAPGRRARSTRSAR